MEKKKHLLLVILAIFSVAITSCSQEDNLTATSVTKSTNFKTTNSRNAFWTSLDSLNAIYGSSQEAATFSRATNLVPVRTDELTTFKKNNFIGGKIADQLGKVAGGWCGKWAGGTLGSLTGNPAFTVFGVWCGRRVGQVAGAIICSYVAQKYLCNKSGMSAKIAHINLNTSIYVNNDSMGVIHNKIMNILTQKDSRYSLPNKGIDYELIYTDCIKLLKKEGIYNDTIANDIDYRLDVISYCKDIAPLVSSCYEGKISGQNILDNGSNTLKQKFNVSEEDIQELKKVCSSTINASNKRNAPQINNYSNALSALIKNSNELNEKEKAELSSSASVGINSSLYWNNLQSQLESCKK